MRQMRQGETKSETKFFGSFLSNETIKWDKWEDNETKMRLLRQKMRQMRQGETKSETKIFVSLLSNETKMRQFFSLIFLLLDKKWDKQFSLIFNLDKLENNKTKNAIKMKQLKQRRQKWD